MLIFRSQDVKIQTDGKDIKIPHCEGEKTFNLARSQCENKPKDQSIRKIQANVFYRIHVKGNVKKIAFHYLYFYYITFLKYNLRYT